MFFNFLAWNFQIPTKEKSIGIAMWPPSSFTNHQRAATSLSTPRTFLLLCSFFLSYSQNIDTLTHAPACRAAPCTCSEHTWWEATMRYEGSTTQGCLLPTCSVSQAADAGPLGRADSYLRWKSYLAVSRISPSALSHPFPARTNTKRRVPSSHLLGWTVHLVTLGEASFTGIFLPHTKHAYEVNWEWQKQESPISPRMRSQGLPDNGAQTPNADPKENKRCHGFCVHFQTKKYTGENKSRFDR